MSTVMDFSDDKLLHVKIFWSEKYACPVYKVCDAMYVEDKDTGEYVKKALDGFFEEVVSPTQNDGEASG